MLLFNFQQQLLNKPLSIALGFAEKKQVMPILANIFIQKINNTLILIANDLEIQYKAKLQTDADVADFALTIPAKKFQDILNTFKDDSIITLESEGDRIKIKSGKSKFSIQTLPAEHFPLLGENEDCISKFQISQIVFKEMLNYVKFSMANNDTRVFLNGALLEIKENMLNLVSTDAHRLSFTNHELNSQENHSVIIPRKTIVELERLLNEDNELLTVKIFKNQIIFETNQHQIISKIIDAKYPDYSKVIPINNDKLCLVNRAVLLKAVNDVSVLGLDKLKALGTTFETDNLTLRCENADQEFSIQEVAVQYQSEIVITMNLNIQYVKDVLSNLTCENVQISLSGSQKSILITKPNQFNFKYVIMPLRG